MIPSPCFNTLHLFYIQPVPSRLCRQVTDVTRPTCREVSTSANCPSSSSLCATSQWEFIANFTDGINGTGIESISIRQGNGTLNTSTVVETGGENVTVVTYSAFCCSPNVELVAVDRVGNLGRCVGQVRQPTTAAPVTTAAGGTTSSRGHTLSITHTLWISVAVSVLWKWKRWLNLQIWIYDIWF